MAKRVSFAFGSPRCATHKPFSVPVFDGRETLALSKYWAQEYKEAVEPNTAVTVLFSMKRGKLTADAEGAKVGDMVGVYLDVLGVVVITQPSETFSLDPSPIPLAIHGVDRLRRLSDVVVEEVGDDVGDDEEESDVEVF